MRVAPLVRRRAVPIGLVVNGGRRVIGEWGTTGWDRVPTGAKLYCCRKRDLYPAIRRGEGRLRMWRRQKLTTFEIRGRRICNLRRALGSLRGEEAFEAIRTWADWLRNHGANVGSPSGSAWSLWRSSLRSVFASWGEEPPGDRLAFGGRQGEREPGVYEDAEIWDLSAAYAFTLGSLELPIRWRAFDHLGPDVPEAPSGYAQAAIAVPPMPWGPLPEQEGPGAVFWPTGEEVEGIWSFDEIRAARAAGCDVLVTKVWTSTSHRAVFADWWTMIEAGRRELPAPAVRLVKVSSNTLWGRFLQAGEAEWWSWPNGGDLLIEPDPVPRRDPTSPAIAGLIASRVRARLWLEGLAPYPDAIACHTDGVILPAGHHLQPNTGGPGRWRLKDRAARLELISAQSFRYIRPDGAMVYRVSGVPEEVAPRVFSRMLRPVERERPNRPDDVEAWLALLREESVKQGA